MKMKIEDFVFFLKINLGFLMKRIDEDEDDITLHTIEFFKTIVHTIEINYAT